ncbi:hypothetical protein GmHk_11G032529 [Glycine max]|nr:hypothetical protein GmHk_11G032529 [Glycine max]
MSSWLQTLNTRDQRSLGSLQEAGFASWLITGHKRPTSFGFIARSGYNFLVFIIGHKGPTFLGVHCKKWE